MGIGERQKNLAAIFENLARGGKPCGMSGIREGRKTLRSKTLTTPSKHCGGRNDTITVSILGI